MTTATFTKVFTKADRCDASQAEQATTYIQLTDDPATGLMFCGHHFDKYRDALEGRQPYIMWDGR